MIGIIPAHIFALVINLLTGIGISLTVIFIIVAGIKYIISGGNKEKSKEARHALINAITGFIIVISSITIVYVIGNLLGWTAVTSQLRTFIPF